MLTGLEESTDMINSIYHTVAVDSLTHHLSLLHEHHAAKSLVQKKKKKKRSCKNFSLEAFEVHIARSFCSCFLV